MGSTQYYLAQTLDGYIAESDGGLDWLFGYGRDMPDSADVEGPMTEGGAYERFFAAVGALAMGSTTYEFLLAHLSDGWPYPDTPSWVFTSRSLPVPDGADVRFTSGSVRAAHDEMRAGAGERNIWLVGGGKLAMQFVDGGLLDELHVTIVPLFLGAGIPTFSGRLGSRLRLTGSRPFENGMVELRYAIAD